MLGFLSYSFLQHYWWAIISLLASLLVFLLFVQGGQSMIFSFAKNETEKTLLINALGRKWEFTFTTLVTFGGAFFASFPLFYSTSFGGAYWAWMALLFCFIIQAVSYEFRKRPNNFLGSRTFEVFLFINGALAPLLIGVVVGTFFTGANFKLDEMNFSSWEHPMRGLEAVFNYINVSLGLAVVFLARVLALHYFMNSISYDGFISRYRKAIVVNSALFLLFFLTFLISILFIDGRAYDAAGVVSIVPNKYLLNLLEMPINTVALLVGVVLVLWGIIKSIRFPEKQKAIWFSGVGTVLTVFALFILAGYNNTCYYPSNVDMQSSLSIQSSCSSEYTLTVMSWVSLIVPFVVAYIFYAWRAINKKDITEAEVSEHGDTHIY
ncbi:cytochrome d ubiquinol oxidase subunit II [Halosquirtibacter xylanolyticus]|uniref:cytochrome d ubiquinol oxidase subunit II n=1 Tax=Halosquirtibacter xylanolyticus TaxID=3374599 RepID=UPI0037482B3D|nr:cytochrome d ubiquinol oxidase subunit II [Prolixibacteraceae bacterium]